MEHRVTSVVTTFSPAPSPAAEEVFFAGAASAVSITFSVTAAISFSSEVSGTSAVSTFASFEAFSFFFDSVSSSS